MPTNIVREARRRGIYELTFEKAAGPTDARGVVAVNVDEDDMAVGRLRQSTTSGRRSSAARPIGKSRRL